MIELRVTITRFVDEEPFPGLVETQFRDAQGQVHMIVDKWPMFSESMLWSDSEYPKPSVAGCTVLERMQGADGRALARIALAWGLETADGQSEFVVDEAELSG
jgi:hypothetical protein